jgi:hypothetical protein
MSEIFYLFKYPERTAGNQQYPWRIRQSEGYHVVNGDQSFYLFLSPRKNSRFEQTIVAKSLFASQPGELRDWMEIEKNPLMIHLTLLTTYLDNWRGLLVDLGRLYQKQVSSSYQMKDVKETVSHGRLISGFGLRS